MIKRLYLRAERHQNAAQALVLKNNKYLERYGDAVRSAKSFKRVTMRVAWLFFKADVLELISLSLKH